MRHLFRSEDGECVMPPVTEPQLRALAALRKPLTDEAAQALVWEHREAVTFSTAYDGDNERWLKANAAGDALVAALTGKTP